MSRSAESDRAPHAFGVARLIRTARTCQKELHSSMPSQKPRTGERTLSGRSVLIMLLGFFGVVMLVNFAMVKAAISTFGGVDRMSSYEAGLAFKAEEARAAAQDAREWQVAGRLSPSGISQVLSVDVVDAAGKPVTGVAVEARLAHPIDERRDVTIALTEVGPGAFSGAAEVLPGAWQLNLAVTRGDEQLFRSTNRITVR